MRENFPNLVNEINIQVQEAQRAPKKSDPKKNTPRHIVIKLPKIKEKERILKAARERQKVTQKGVPVRLSADFSKETLQARRGQKEVSQIMKGKDLHPNYSIQQNDHLEWKQYSWIKLYCYRLKNSDNIKISHPILFIRNIMKNNKKYT